MSMAQHERQRTRKCGRYSVMHVCERCGKHLGADYCSAQNCNTTGVGLVLCEKCCIQADKEAGKTWK